MGASPIIREVYRQHIERWGEPDDYIVYEDDDAPLARIDIAVWQASAASGVTTFSTIGMADLPMSGAPHRAEVHFSIRCHLDPTTVREVSLFLASLSVVPFQDNTFFDWWHQVRWPWGIPLFPSAMGVIFHPRFVEEGWDTMTIDGVVVRILNAVPITSEEYRIGFPGIFEHWEKINIDLFEPR